MLLGAVGLRDEHPAAHSVTRTARAARFRRTVIRAALPYTGTHPLRPWSRASDVRSTSPLFDSVMVAPFDLVVHPSDPDKS